MQGSGSVKVPRNDCLTEHENFEDSESAEKASSKSNVVTEESVIDVSGKNVEFSLLENIDDDVEGMYLYKNAFNLIPRSLGGLGRLKTFKFFSNEINLFPAEFGNLVELERLQLKVSTLGLSGLPLHKLKALKELELFKVPRSFSAFPILGEIAALKSLKKLSICHFSIRYLPSEIGVLDKLEYLDLSFNKLKNLPTELCKLNALISLKVANNKLVELPSSLSSLQRLENLDLSSNRLMSLGSLQLDSMHSLRNLDLKHNKLLSCCKIPSWICCSLEGNGKEESYDEFISYSVEMDVNENATLDNDFSCNGSSSTTASSLLNATSVNNKNSPARRFKRWNRRYYLQQIARQQSLNSRRKWKGENHFEALRMKMPETCNLSNLAAHALDSNAGGISSTVVLDNNDAKKLGLALDSKMLISRVDNGEISIESCSDDDNCSSVVDESISTSKEDKDVGYDSDSASAFIENQDGNQDEGSSSELSITTPKAKRHSDKILDNPKPCKSRRPTDGCSDLSRKYSVTSFFGIEDHLLDGFYDAGRDRPFMPLRNYKQTPKLDSREVILLDRTMDEQLDAVVLSAQALVFNLTQLTEDSKPLAVGNLHVASLLALFVSDNFGGSDKSSIIERARKAVSGSNYDKPFICTCSTGNSDNPSACIKMGLDAVEDVDLRELCDLSIQSIKTRRNSIVVPLGTLQFGVCRHRALLMKYLCDRMDPPISCELVRGYLDFMPHAWNVILVRKGDSYVRMVVDACRPQDIREETDLEYFCRYIPLSRIKISFAAQSGHSPHSSFPDVITRDEIKKTGATSLVQCNFGSTEAVAKVRTLEVCKISADEVKNFEYSCLGEVRMLSALKHSCIVEIYGHQFSSKWVPSLDGCSEHQILQSVILMEHIKGGSLKLYLDKMSKAGKKHVPLQLALCVAKDVASALVELHSKHIIHRDIKSENILIDLDGKTSDGTTIVKLCDFDQAVPLRSSLHTCCIAHTGIPPPNVCVGTPRWMAPEVLQAIHKRNTYGLEVDIWSYGCLLLELLTLEIPYSGLPDSDFPGLLQMGKRPQLTDELEELTTKDTATIATEAEVDSLKFLADLYRRCTVENPSDRPTAKHVREMLLSHMSTCPESRS